MEQASHSSQGTVQVACSAASSPACSSFTQLHQQDLPSFVHSYMLPACNAATTLHSCRLAVQQTCQQPSLCSCEAAYMQLRQAGMQQCSRVCTAAVGLLTSQ